MSNDFSELSKKKKFVLRNIPFYLIITTLIFGIHLLHIFVNFSHDVSKIIKLTSIALIESSIEGGLLCFFGSVFASVPVLRSVFIIIAAFFPVFHLIDMILERLFNVGFLETLMTVFSETLANMLELLYATNISLGIWLCGFLTLLGIGAIFIILYKRTEHVSLQLSVAKNKSKAVSVFLFFISAYIPLKSSVDTSVSLHLHEVKVLPFKNILAGFRNKDDVLFFTRSNPSKKMVLKSNYDGHLFLFIVESLRNDAIFAKSAPHLSQLGENYFRHPNCLASANGTHLSWYSLFFGKASMLWKTETTRGSPYLEDLKFDGYDIQILSSARLSYYGMDKLIMGENYELASQYYCPKIDQNMTAFEADLACFQKLQSLIQQAKKKTAFVVFLDATHFGYSLPQNTQGPYLPFADSIPYFSTVFSSVDVDLIKNRYLNTIYELDKLFGDLFGMLKTQGIFDKSLIMITADHGEEFFEKGQLFHASHLSSEQLHIPFIVKPPQGYTQSLGFSKILSHSDMFPMMRSIVTDQPYEDRTWQISARFNFAQSPKEVAISTKEGKAIYKVNLKTQTFELYKNVDLKDMPRNVKLELPRTINLDPSSKL